MVTEVLNFFAWGGFSGGGIGDVLDKWAQVGVFSYVLPFLLLFALIFAVLSKAKMLGDNKAVNVIIALVVALMALQFDFVPRFFSEVFPRVGVGLSIILIILIIAGLFIPDFSKGGFVAAFLIIAATIIIVILVNTAGALGWSTGFWWQDNWDNILIVVVVLGGLGWIIGSTKSSPSPGK